MDKKSLKELVIIGRKIERCGLVIGEGGNISARAGNVVYIKSRGVSMGCAGTDDYVSVDVKTGKALIKGARPSSEIYLHLACYRKRKDIRAVVHAHPVFATALADTDYDFKPLPYETACCIKSPVAKIRYIKPGSKKLAGKVGSAIAGHNAVLLKRHGLVTVGGDIKEAFLRALAVERAAIGAVCSSIIKR